MKDWVISLSPVDERRCSPPSRDSARRCATQRALRLDEHATPDLPLDVTPDKDDERTLKLTGKDKWPLATWLTLGLFLLSLSVATYEFMCGDLLSSTDDNKPVFSDWHL